MFAEKNKIEEIEEVDELDVFIDKLLTLAKAYKIGDNYGIPEEFAVKIMITSLDMFAGNLNELNEILENEEEDE